MATEVSGLSIENLSASYSLSNSSYGSGSCEAGSDGTSLTCTATGYVRSSTSYAMTNTVTLANGGSLAAALSFSYEPTLNGGSLTVDGEGISEVGTFEKTLWPGESVTIALSSAKGAYTATLTLSAIALTVPEAITTTFAPGSGGTYTVDGVEVGEDGLTLTQTAEEALEGYVLASPTPEDGYRFYGWFGVTQQAYIGWGQKKTFVSAGDQTVAAFFENLESSRYKYRLIERLRRHISLIGVGSYYRLYFYNFFGAVFDASVVITEESYKNFCSLMDEELEACAENGIRTAYEMYNSDYYEPGCALLEEAFAAVGVTMSVSGYAVTFVLPDGVTLSYDMTALGMTYGEDCIAINSISGTVYPYAQLSAPWYSLELPGVPDEPDFHKCGPDAYWSYDDEAKTMTITGSYEYSGGLSYSEELGMGEYTTVILGAGITKIASESMTDITCVVLLHPADGYIEIDPDFNLVSGTCSNSYCEVTIYTDCEMALATEGLTNVTFYSLDEWEG